MNDCDNFFITVGYVATIAIIFLLGALSGCDVGKSPRFHHTWYRDAHGEITCKICKEILEKGNR
jgi:hypothetical protein